MQNKTFADYKRPFACSKEDGSMMQPDQLEPSLRDLILKPKSKKIPRPPNAFMLFARDHRKTLAKKYPTQSNKNISSLLGQCWKKLDEATKAEYYKKAKMLEELHRQQYPGYVYSPRIARMQKMARKKKYLDKCGDDKETNDDEIPLEPTGPSNTCNHGSEKCGEWNYNNSEKKQSSPGYIPNNPQYFPDPEHGPQPEPPCTAESNTPTMESEAYACPSCPPPPWNMPPVESIAVPCAGRCQDECGARSDMYAENYYPKIGHSEMYDYGPWNRYPDYPYESPVSSTWSACSAGCQGECSRIHPNDEHSSYSHLTSSQHPDLKNSYYHYNPPAPYRNPPYPCSYGPYSDSPMPYMPRRYVPYKTGPKVHSSYLPQSMDYYHNQYQQHFKDYYPKYPYATQPTDCPTMQETTCPSGHPAEVYDCRSVHTEEMTESSNTSQGADSKHQDVERENTESDGNEMVNVVDVESEESNILTEEVVESTNPELGEVDQDVYVI
ncbi:hypothetical protein AVEN_134610-1 [Araneus ventricosus]|uniref:HMG box domain-containing protein n=1 Tax=Araneus ventricosus TaxID=182803 RepID=A0A4Y2NCI4_ARAVE|nr:hypothetical protein AVEN_134610-1 [Araneus ventricosus]